MTRDPNSPQIVTEFLSELEARSLVEHLRGLGFDAHPWGAYLYLFYGEGATEGGIQVVVRHSEAEQARQAVEAFHSTQRRPIVVTESRSH